MRTEPLPATGSPERRRLLERGSTPRPHEREAVSAILRKVSEQGDAAVRSFTEQFDRVELHELEVARTEWTQSESKLSGPAKSALRTMMENIRRFHAHGIFRSFEQEPVRGITLGMLAVPFERVGIYVPGGRACYPSTLLMAAIPAKLAGVREVIVCTPPRRDGHLAAETLYAAGLAGVDRLFTIGGAQAIAAMAYGTESMPRVDCLVGPGNKYVTLAKESISDRVRIDFPAGPTEILIISDGTTPSGFVAADLVAQAEHDPDAVTLLVTPSKEHADQVRSEVDALSKKETRHEIIEQAILQNGRIFLVNSLDDAITFANEYAAEHLVLACRDGKRILQRIRSAGSIFVGDYSPVAAGDYGAGPNHILPTGGQARFTGALTANFFLKMIPYQHLLREGLSLLSPSMTLIAAMEGLEAHRKSITVRLE